MRFFKTSIPSGCITLRLSEDLLRFKLLKNPLRFIPDIPSANGGAPLM